MLERDPNYWAKDLPISRGLYNFDRIRIDYYRDATAMFEAFKAGLIDYRVEDDPNRWRNEYDFPAARDGRVIKAAIPSGLPKGVSGFAFNTRRPAFADVRVREALASMFDFEWINANLYDGAYKRSEGFFDDSELSSIGRPASERERALLEPFPGAVRDDVMEGEWRAPVSDGSGRDRAIAKSALDELAAAGYSLRDGRLVDAHGAPLAFEILVRNRDEERLALAYARNLARIGVAANVRLVDEVQFQRRRTSFDFDMMIGSWIASPSPGNEQRGRWSSAAANAQGAYNISGVASPAVDAMIAAILAAKTNEDFVAAVRALDRLLISGFYIVPLYYAPEQWIAYSAKLGRPGQDAAVRRRASELVAQGALRSLSQTDGAGSLPSRHWAVTCDPADPFGFSWARPFCVRKPPILSGWISLDFLAILSSETRLFNGLRGIFRRNFFLSRFLFTLAALEEDLAS